MEKISGQTKCLEKELGTQETTIRDYNEELNVAEEAARVALVESIGLQRKLFMGPPPSSRSTLYDRSMESCNSSVYSQGPPVKTPPKVTSGQPDADDEFWAARQTKR
ncbi:hypothetical protein Pmar_PMAR017931 [Perkinsus marinus ATCC 50983]|uniref:Uncharacterized protein n=1 Tax=Perkinsus marinus (strain ATCC 50983 / TXsc) TaxID=423536 RepID=C5LIB2_PERM5|nr:hypothetical protein Pmar_PMAR017931 [Perkinsus marinus ATCC 50983]EER03528.1 hypothetical protein Pmar_PMAR017931 [Perkinsus marinus ATCC 50983]|eukprot:XP_002771712.1 hypothetical protein Pmar_PMAR017931 [Perkinsus marinus ATCC 50983]